MFMFEIVQHFAVFWEFSLLVSWAWCWSYFGHHWNSLGGPDQCGSGMEKYKWLASCLWIEWKITTEQGMNEFYRMQNKLITGLSESAKNSGEEVKEQVLHLMWLHWTVSGDGDCWDWRTEREYQCLIPLDCWEVRGKSRCCRSVYSSGSIHWC